MWVAVGWSSDVLPAVKRMRNVAMVVPRSGASLWADLWVCISAFYSRVCFCFSDEITTSKLLSHNCGEMMMKLGTKG